jgi:hypothetical protein
MKHETCIGTFGINKNVVGRTEKKVAPLRFSCKCFPGLFSIEMENDLQTALNNDLHHDGFGTVITPHCGHRHRPW